MKRNQKAQQIVEYLLMLVVIVLVVFYIVSPSGPFRNYVNNTLNMAIETIYE